MPNCGSNSAIKINENEYRCEKCDSVFKYDNGPKTIVIDNRTMAKEPVSTDRYAYHYVGEYEINEQQAKEAVIDFFMEGYAHRGLTRKEAEQLYGRPTEKAMLPSDILKMEIKSVRKSSLGIAYFKGLFDINFSYTEGIKEVETYYEDGKKKERDYIKWHPRDGRVKEKDSGNYFVEGPDNLPLNSNDFIEHIGEEYEKTRRLCEKDIKLNKKDMEAAIYHLARLKAEYNMERGDGTKDFKMSFVFEPENISYITLPIYVVEIEYRGQRYELGVTACGPVQVEWKTGYTAPGPTEDDLKLKERTNAAGQAALRKVYPIHISGIALLIIGVVLPIVLLTTVSPIGLVSAILCVPGILLMRLGNKKTNKVRKDFAALLDQQEKILLNQKTPDYNKQMESIGSSKRAEIDPSVPSDFSTAITVGSVAEVKESNTSDASIADTKETEVIENAKKPVSGPFIVLLVMNVFTLILALGSSFHASFSDCVSIGYDTFSFLSAGGYGPICLLIAIFSFSLLALSIALIVLTILKKTPILTALNFVTFGISLTAGVFAIISTPNGNFQRGEFFGSLVAWWLMAIMILQFIAFVLDIVILIINRRRYFAFIYKRIRHKKA